MKQNFTGSINGTQYDDFYKFLNDLNHLDKEKQVNVSFSFETDSDKTDTKEIDLSKEEIIKKELIGNFEPICNIHMLKDSSLCGKELHRLDQDMYDKGKKFDKFLRTSTAGLPFKSTLLKFINERIFVWETQETKIFAKLEDLQTNYKVIQSELSELKFKYKDLLKKKDQCSQEISNLTGIKVATLRIHRYWKALKQIILNDLNN